MLHVDINDSLEEVLCRDPRQYVFLGVQYHHDSHSTELSPKMRRKLERIAATKPETIAQLTLRETMSHYGTLVAASLITGNCRGKYYYLTKFFRRAVGRDLDSPACVWRSVLSLFAQWAQDELEKSPRQWQDLSPDDTRVLLFTDASLDGYGTVAFVNDGTVHIKGAPWKHKGHSPGFINVLEAKALEYGLDMVEATFPRACSHNALQIEVRVDNTSLCCRAPKGSSKSFHLNQAIQALQAHKMWPHVTSIEYVKTSINHADWVSRQKCHLEAHLHNAIQYTRLRSLQLQAHHFGFLTPV
jgi:hypothetical protein